MHSILQLVESGTLTHILFGTFTAMIHFVGDSPRQLSESRGGVVCTPSGAVIAETYSGPEFIELPGAASAWTDEIPRGWSTRSTETGIVSLWNTSGSVVAPDLPSSACPGYPYFVSPDRRIVILEAGERQSTCASRVGTGFKSLPTAGNTGKILHTVWLGVDEAAAWGKNKPWGYRLRIGTDQQIVDRVFHSPVQGQPEPWTAAVDSNKHVWMTHQNEDGKRGVLVVDPDDGRWRRYGWADLPEIEMLKVLDGRPLALSSDGGVWSVGRQRSVLLVPPRADGRYVTGFCGKKVGRELRVYVALTTSIDKWVRSTVDSYEVWSSPAER